MIENAEVIQNSDKIDLGSIGIIGGKKKKKPIEEPQPLPPNNDDISFNQESENVGSGLLKEKTTQPYYDPFSKYVDPPRNENIWHYSLFPSTGNKKNNPPGLSLFTTNRENKYSMFSNNFYCNKNQEEDENEEENEKQGTSFEEKSDSEFSERSFLQNRLHTPNYKSDQLEKKENVDLSVNKNEQDSTSRYFRAFNFPQGNNPFSLSQLLNPKHNEENSNFKGIEIEKEKEKNLNLNAVAFTGNYENIVGGNKNPNFFYGFSEENEQIGKIIGSIGFRPNNSSSDNISRKPPPGFKPNK